jgi:hypothetical protein
MNGKGYGRKRSSVTLELLQYLPVGTGENFEPGYSTGRNWGKL